MKGLRSVVGRLLIELVAKVQGHTIAQQLVVLHREPTVFWGTDSARGRRLARGSAVGSLDANGCVALPLRHFPVLLTVLVCPVFCSTFLHDALKKVPQGRQIGYQNLERTAI